MQIIIVGAGIAGLSSYIFLTKHLLDNHSSESHNIKIIERYDIRHTKDITPDNDNGNENDSDNSTLHSPDKTTDIPKTIGSAIGIGKNGLSVLSRMDNEGRVLAQFKRRGNCISTWEMGTARGFKLVDANVASSRKPVTGTRVGDKDGDEGDRKTDGEGVGGSQPTVMIARQVAWEILRDRVVEIDDDAVTIGKVVEIRSTEGGPATVVLENRQELVADLVIGADGLKSIVRRVMFENTKDTEALSWWEWFLGRTQQRKDYITPHYEGLTGLGGIVPGCVLRQAGFEAGAMSITFGPNGFFGHGYVSPVTESDSSDSRDTSLAAWWSTFSSPGPNPFQPATSPNNEPQTTNSTINKEAALSNLRTRHSSWQDPVIQAILDYVTKHRAVDHVYPTYTTPELPTWHKENLVLIGDAAHALQPSSGQGACQALEDAECLALLLSRYLPTSDDKTDDQQAIKSALNTFTSLRKPRLAKIYVQSQKFGKMKSDMNVVQEFSMYFFVWLGARIGMWKRYNDELFEYDLPGEVERIFAAKG